MNDTSLNGKTAVVTGASRGLGRAMALALGKAGANLALIARDLQALEETAQMARTSGATVEVFPADVTDEAQVERVRQAVLERFGTVDILINNAGVNVRKLIHEFSLEEWRKVTDTNLTSVFLLCRAFVPSMKGKGYGRILNLTSIMSHISLPGRAAYSASKAGLLGLTKALALELAPDHVSVIAISPGPFATEMNQPLIQNAELNQQFLARIPAGRWGEVEDIGQLAVYLCSPYASFITGTDILIDGGWTAQ